jgi:hypothetical protein
METAGTLGTTFQTSALSDESEVELWNFIDQKFETKNSMNSTSDPYL